MLGVVGGGEGIEYINDTLSKIILACDDRLVIPVLEHRCGQLKLLRP